MRRRRENLGYPEVQNAPQAQNFRAFKGTKCAAGAKKTDRSIANLTRPVELAISTDFYLIRPVELINSTKIN